MRIGIIGAMEQEVKLFSECMSIENIETIGMRQYYLGRMHGKEIVLVFSKIGKVAAASTVTTLIETFKADLIIFTGVAGAADNSLKIGDIVISDSLVQHDMDASALIGFKKYEIPLLGVAEFKVPEKLVQLAKHSAQEYVESTMGKDVSQEYLKEFDISTPHVVSGTIASGDQFIADSEKVKILCSEIRNLKCIEMEGAAVAQVCYEHNVNFVIFRVISDKADEHANINFPRFIEKTASHFTCGITQYLIKEI